MVYVLFFVITSHVHVCTEPVLASLVSALSASGVGGVGRWNLLSLKYYVIFVTSSIYSLPFILFMSLGRTEYFRWATSILQSESCASLAT